MYVSIRVWRYSMPRTVIHTAYLEGFYIVFCIYYHLLVVIQLTAPISPDCNMCRTTDRTSELSMLLSTSKNPI